MEKSMQKECAVANPPGTPSPYELVSWVDSATWRAGSASSGITKDLAVKMLKAKKLPGKLSVVGCQNAISIVAKPGGPTGHFREVYLWSE